MLWFLKSIIYLFFSYNNFQVRGHGDGFVLQRFEEFLWFIKTSSHDLPRRSRVNNVYSSLCLRCQNYVLMLLLLAIATKQSDPLLFNSLVRIYGLTFMVTSLEEKNLYGICWSAFWLQNSKRCTCKLEQREWVGEWVRPTADCTVLDSSY